MNLCVWIFGKWKLWAALLLLGLVIVGGMIVMSRVTIAKSAEDRIFDKASEVPECEVALLLGCVRILPNGRENLYFKYRIAAVKELWEARRIEHVLVSGDNSREDYDEASDMRAALIEAGIPGERIHRDYAGFRTLDSVVRARDVFLLDRMVVVSQRFHVERALYLAREMGIEAWGFPAKDVARRSGARTRAREELARVKAVLDVKIFGTQPKFRGEPVPIVGGNPR